MAAFASDFDHSLPYPSSRAPVLAHNVVATSQPLAVQAGISILRRGGNAVDAALAAAITLTVVEPTSNGIGGDLFAILNSEGELHGLNSSGRSPRSLDPARFAGLSAMPRHGWAPVTVPGAVAGWAELSARFGKVEFPQLFDDAIRYAQDGFPVSPITAAAWGRAAQVLGDFEDFAAAFLPGGRAPRAGETFRLSDQASTLRRIAASGGKDFYQGELAGRIAAHAAATGGQLSEADLAAHRSDWTGVISQAAFGTELHQIPPNGQGLAALIALGILAGTDIASMERDSVPALHLQIEAMKLAFADVFRYVCDADFMQLTVDELLDRDYLAGRAELISGSRAGDYGPGEPRAGGTVYVSAADSSGMMVSLIQSNYMGFGSGIVVPGTGIALQNRGAGFSVDSSHPNHVAGGKRPFHTIIPGFLTQGGEPAMSFGVMGGHMQAQGHVQMVLRTAVWNQNPQAASDAPRWQVLEDGVIALEAGMPEATVAGLRELGHRVSVREPVEFGGAQVITRLSSGAYMAGSDHRKDGHAAGF